MSASWVQSKLKKLDRLSCNVPSAWLETAIPPPQGTWFVLQQERTVPTKSSCFGWSKTVLSNNPPETLLDVTLYQIYICWESCITSGKWPHRLNTDQGKRTCIFSQLMRLQEFSQEGWKHSANRSAKCRQWVQDLSVLKVKLKKHEKRPHLECQFLEVRCTRLPCTSLHFLQSPNLAISRVQIRLRVLEKFPLADAHMSHNWRSTVNSNETHHLCFVFQNWNDSHPLPHSNPTPSISTKNKQSFYFLNKITLNSTICFMYQLYQPSKHVVWRPNPRVVPWCRWALARCHDPKSWPWSPP